MRVECQNCLEGFRPGYRQMLEKNIRISVLAKQEFLSSTCILVDGFILSKITEQTVLNMRNPSNLPDDMQGAQMNESK